MFTTSKHQNELLCTARCLPDRRIAPEEDKHAPIEAQGQRMKMGRASVCGSLGFKESGVAK